jgi:aspartate-semialdehyde dehydrogenase
MDVAVLGATGAVGQRFVQLLEGHPFFTVRELAASGRSAGQRYAEACRWNLSTPLPERVGNLVVRDLDAPLASPLVFSALPAEVAGEVEDRLADAGHAVSTNASKHRMDPDVPLLVPEVNWNHLEAVAAQRERRRSRGFIVANPNCSTIALVLGLKPLHDAYRIERMMVTTLQALSGAGYPGVPSMDIIDNVVPHIGGEEHKMETEPRKIMGAWRAGAFVDANIAISAACNRVATSDGHLECVSVDLGLKVSLDEVRAAWQEYRSPLAEMKLPSAPDPVVVVRDEPDRPQPRLDRDTGRGMAVVVGRLRRCPILDYKFVLLGHNTVRGAAGGAILNAEIMYAKGLIG